MCAFVCVCCFCAVWFGNQLCVLHHVLQIKKGPNKGQMVEQMKRQIAVEAVSSVSLR